MDHKIPYKIYLEEHEMPKEWYNVRADMKKKPAPILNPETLQPVTEDELSAIFCRELAKQELDDKTPYFEIPEEIRNFYRMYRPAPLVRAYCLEERLDTPAHIYYKFEGNNTSGSHKLNSAIAQAYYAKQQGLKVLDRGVNRSENNSTRFLIVTNQPIFCKDAKKVSICFEVTHESGCLYNVLSHFIYNNLNMCRIESRPIPSVKSRFR